MALVYMIEGDENDFFDNIAFCNDDDDWEDFAQDIAKHAAAHDKHDKRYTKFVKHLHEHGYMDQIADIIYEAQKTFANEYIDATGAPFEYC